MQSKRCSPAAETVLKFTADDGDISQRRPLVMTSMTRRAPSLKVHVLVGVPPASNGRGLASRAWSVIVEPGYNTKRPTGVSRVHRGDKSVELSHVLIEEARAEQVGVARNQLTDPDTHNEYTTTLRAAANTTASSESLSESIVEWTSGVCSRTMSSCIRSDNDGRSLSREITCLRLYERSLAHAVLVRRSSADGGIVPRVEGYAEGTELSCVPRT